MSGKIAIEMSSADRYRHSLELLMSKNQLEAKQKLHDAYDPALRALTAKPEMVLESGRVKINAPIAAKANLGPYAIDVQAETPNHMSGSLKPPAINGTVEAGGRQYNYEAEIELKADVLWHPKPRGKVDELVRIPAQQQDRQFAYLKENTIEKNTIDWQKIGQEAKKVAVVVTVSLAAAAAAVAAALASGLFGVGASLNQPGTTMVAFTHVIDFPQKDKKA